MRLPIGVMVAFTIFVATQFGFGDIIPSQRRIDWRNNVGIDGDIPLRSSVFANVRQAPYNASGNGSTDDSGAIQAAIDSCPTGKVVYIPAGVYLLSHRIRMKSGITLRGAGMGSTILKGSSGFSDPYLIGFEKEGIIFDQIYETARDITSGFTKGSSSIFVPSTGWSSGDLILIDQIKDPTGDPVITNEGTDGICTWCSRENGNRPIGQISQIESISGAVNITTPLYYTYSASRIPQASRIKPTYIIADSGLEDLSLDNSLSKNNSQYNYGVVYMVCTVNCWLLNIEVNTVYKTGIKLSHSYRDVIRGCTVHDSYAYTSDAGYGLYFTFGVSGTVFENNVFHTLTVGIIYNGPVSGNVIAYNYMTAMTSTTFPNAVRNGLIAHGAHPVMNLFEGNYLEGPGISCDLYWGTSSHNTYFRNYVAIDPNKSVGTADLSLWKGQTYYNIVGNVLGTSGNERIYQLLDLYGGRMIYNLDYTNNGSSDGKSAATILRHGNYDTVSASVIWDPAIADHTIPASLYLDSQPLWWIDVPWPAIGPDLNPMIGNIPARVRFGERDASPQSPLPPVHLRIKG